MMSSHSIRHFGRTSMVCRVVKKSTKIPTVFQGDKKGGPHRRHKALHLYQKSKSPSELYNEYLQTPLPVISLLHERNYV